jgi:hypothetical protein
MRVPPIRLRLAVLCAAGALLAGAVHAAPPAGYDIVHADGSPCCTAGTATRAYLRSTATAARPVRAPVIERLFEDNFEVEIDGDSILTTPHGDFLVLTMSRPAAYSLTYVPCAAGMGESRAYLVAVTAKGVKVISRSFGGCGRAYRVVRDGAEAGYVVADAGTQAHAVRYRLRDDGTVRRD